MAECKCNDCLHLAWRRGKHAERTEYYCFHPDKEHIKAYYDEHKMFSMPGFLGFGYGRVTRKTTPPWCPLNKKKEIKK